MGMMIFPTLLLFEYYRTKRDGDDQSDQGKESQRTLIDGGASCAGRPVRLEIVRQLDEAGKKAYGIFGIDMPKSSLSHHFRILRKSGVIVSETQGTIIMNRLRRKDLEARFPGVLKSILAATRQEDRVIQRRG